MTDAASWNAVSTDLQGQGFTVLTPPNLLHGVAGDAVPHGRGPRVTREFPMAFMSDRSASEEGQLGRLGTPV